MPPRPQCSHILMFPLSQYPSRSQRPSKFNHSLPSHLSVGLGLSCAGVGRQAGGRGGTEQAGGGGRGLGVGRGGPRLRGGEGARVPQGGACPARPKERGCGVSSDDGHSRRLLSMAAWSSRGAGRPRLAFVRIQVFAPARLGRTGWEVGWEEAGPQLIQPHTRTKALGGPPQTPADAAAPAGAPRLAPTARLASLGVVAAGRPVVGRLSRA